MLAPLSSVGIPKKGSKEWSDNPTAAAELNYTPDPDDGLFWISKRDAFRYYQSFYVLLKAMDVEMAAKSVAEVRPPRYCGLTMLITVHIMVD